MLPMPVMLSISSLFYGLVYYVIGYRKRVVQHNFEKSFPTKSKHQIKQEIKQFYKHFCDLLFETAKTLSIREREIDKRFILKNPELLEEFYDQKKSIILYTSHYGNWEWLAFLPLYTSYTCTAFYQPLKNKYFDTLVKAIRERFGVQCIPSKNGYKTLMQKHKNGELTINYIISDQSPQASASKHWVKFLNQDTAFLIGSERMAKRMNMAVVYPEFRQPKRGVYEITFKTITEDAGKTEGYSIIDTYARLLEENIELDPSLWLWSHRRWKLNRPYKE